jgi:Glucanosyltransferase
LQHSQFNNNQSFIYRIFFPPRISITMATPRTTTPVVLIQDRFLVTDTTNTRFFVRGIAFPDSPVEKSEDPVPHVEYNPAGWISVLEQLRGAMPEEALNTVRLYRLDADVDYSEFYEAAARLGFYVLIPLTGNKGHAVLDRLKAPPHCYPPGLWEYGKRMVESSMKHPNILAGLIGNEVMNSMESWYAAPCIKAYARDLKLYMKELQDRIREDPVLQAKYESRTTAQGTLAPLPLMYAAQDSGIGAALSNVDTIRLSVDYLSCNLDGDSTERDDLSLDILGVNVESWCATRDTFQYNDDGTVGTFYQLWKGLHPNIDVPLVFSELGCSHLFFNRDTPELKTPEGTRDWTEIPVVLEDMQDTWSGFSAYAYWGNSQFNMMEGGPWNGVDVLEPTQDFENFQQQCLFSSVLGNEQSAMSAAKNLDPHLAHGGLHDLPMQNGGIMEDYYQLLQENDAPPSCAQVEGVLAMAAGLQLESVKNIPSHYGNDTGIFMMASSNLAMSFASPSVRSLPLTAQQKSQNRRQQWSCFAVLAGLLVGFAGLRHWNNSRRGKYEKIPDGN